METSTSLADDHLKQRIYHVAEEVKAGELDALAAASQLLRECDALGVSPETAELTRWYSTRLMARDELNHLRELEAESDEARRKIEILLAENAVSRPAWSNSGS
jgi:hypothetical protein